MTSTLQEVLVTLDLVLGGVGARTGRMEGGLNLEEAKLQPIVPLNAGSWSDARRLTWLVERGRSSLVHFTDTGILYPREHLSPCRELATQSLTALPRRRRR